MVRAGRVILLLPLAWWTWTFLAQPMRQDEIYDVFLSVLRVHGLAAVPSGSMVKIVPEADAKQQGGAVIGGTVRGGGDQLVTQVITLRNESATQLVPILRPLISPVFWSK